MKQSFEVMQQRIALALTEDDPANYDSVKEECLSYHDIDHIANLIASVVMEAKEIAST